MSSGNPIVVLGGGISGLSCAYYLNKIGRSAIGNRKIMVLEGKKRMGGWLQTNRCEDGVIHELGPRSIRFNGKMGMNTISLIEDVGIGNDLLGKTSLNNRYIYADGKLIQLPIGCFNLFRKAPPVLKKSLLSYAISEMRKSKLDVPPSDDISIFDFFAKRCDSHLVNYIIDPLFKNYDISDKAIEASNKQWATFSLREGIEQLPEALSEHLTRQPNVQICNESEVKSINFNQNNVPVTLTEKSAAEQEDIIVDADYVISALPANKLSQILPPEQSLIKKKLDTIDWVNVAVVCLEYSSKK